MTPPIHKVFPADEDTRADRDPESSQTVVAYSGDDLCGFVESSFEPWNRRLTICDIEVAPGWRGRGLGRTLMSHAFDFAEERGAGHVWLEVSNINAPRSAPTCGWGARMVVRGGGGSQLRARGTDGAECDEFLGTGRSECVSDQPLSTS
ncbi:GNAT family N-acetyltransferase [Actinomadura luteofluorescens]|uniref:GNAT family N-acetyltransferase n=1 Tax=Actinomadura luteofluorescens TaxID=46163 RepID=UPI0035E43D47